MAFNGNNMTPLGGNARAGENALDRNAPMGWAYQSKTDDLSTVLGAGYFDTFHLYLVAGQFIYASLTDQKVFITIQSVDHVLKQVVADTEVIAPTDFPLSVELFTGANKNLVVADNLKFFVMDSVANQVVTIPDNNSEAFPVGAEIGFIREGDGGLRFTTSGAAVLHSKSGFTHASDQYGQAVLKKIAEDEWRLSGDLSVAPAFSPTDIADILTWHDASNASSILEETVGGRVSSWLDLSGNGNDLIPPSIAAEPATGTDMINGLNVLSFDSLVQALRVDITVSPNVTIFAVSRVSSTNESFDSILSFSTGIGMDIQIDRGTANNQWRGRFNTDGLGEIPDSSELQNSTNLNDINTIIIARLSVADLETSLRINGVSLGTDTYNGLLTSAVNYRVGENRNGDFMPLMQGAEFIVYNRALSSGEIADVESYLVLKWAIAM